MSAEGPHEAALAQEALHVVLQDLAGRLDDQSMTTARALLAEGWTTEAAAAARDALDEAVAARPAAVAGMSGVLRGALERAAVGAVAEYARTDLPSRWWFTAPEAGLGDLQTVPVAQLEEVEAVACWRAVRRPLDGSTSPGQPPGDAVEAAPGREVYLVELPADAGPGEPARCAGAVQAALAVLGVPEPQVEVARAGTTLPTYQRSIRAGGTLLWPERVDPELRLARVYDGLDLSEEPVFHEGHAVLPKEERAALLRRLGLGVLVLQTTAPLPDVVDPARPQRVPNAFRTDGQWVWHEATRYYLEHYGLAPEEDFLAHLRLDLDRSDGPDPAGASVESTDVYRALQLLTRSAG